MKIIIQSDNNQEVKRFYVYGHYTNNDELFYIGVGKILNLKTRKETQKYSRAYHFCSRTKFWKNIRNKNGVVVKILSEFYTKEESLLEERRLIEKFGRRTFKKGSLCNLSSGGEVGPVGRVLKMSAEQKKKLSDIRSITLYIYDSTGNFLTEIRTIKAAAEYCGVTYNAIYSCMQTKNYSNGYFIFKGFKGNSLGYTVDNLSFKSTLSKIVITEDLSGKIVEHESIMACSRFLGCDKSSIQGSIKRGGKCKKHKIYLKA